MSGISLRNFVVAAILAACIAAVGIVSAAGTDDSSKPETLGQVAEEQKAQGDLPEGGRHTQSYAPPQAADMEPATNARYQAAVQAFYDYQITGLAHRERVFGWQLLSSRIIFGVVLLLVAAGIYFAALQFHGARNQRLTGTSRDPETELKISAAGVEVKSSVLGVIVLTISLAFFYLYLKFVYPIEEIF